MPQTCKNCNQTFEGNYCNHCGQHADIKKINLRFLWYDLHSGLFNFDSGIFYSLKQLFIRPGHTIREFLEGKRVHHFKPMSLVVILATAYSFVYHLLGMQFFEATTNSTSESINEGLQTISSFFENHYAITSLLNIPFYALATRVCFSKQNRSYAEHFVANTFITSQRLMLNIIVLPIKYFIGDQDSNVNLLIFLVLMALFIWDYTQLFSGMKRSKAIFMSLLAYVWGSLMLLIAMLATMLLFALL